MNATTTCTYQYQTVAGTLDSYPVVSTSQCLTTSTTTYATSTPLTTVQYGDWLLVNGIIVFFLAFVVLANMASAFKFK